LVSRPAHAHQRCPSLPSGLVAELQASQMQSLQIAS